jgi:predicted GNAT family N-acyltransferase
VAEKSQHTQFWVEPLGPGHNRADFSSGVEALDNYLRTQAGQDARSRVAVPFVLTADGKTIAGYYTLSQFAVDLSLMPEAIGHKLPKYPLIPATLIGRLAISKAFRGQRLGEFLLMDALQRSLEGSERIGSFAVVVDAQDEGAAAFYRKYGFIDLPKVPRRLFLPLKTIERMFA